MVKHVLVLGGSYFTGRVYAMAAAKAGDVHLHVVNRGRFSLGLEHVTEYRCDRHDPSLLAKRLPRQSFDALVDFCAYTPGDVAGITACLDGQIGHYILFSTASLYRPDCVYPSEDAPLVQTFPPGQVGDYLRAKRILEKELTACCGEALPWTILRPAFIYGPYNYAPRESWLIRQIVQGVPVPFPEDAVGRWSAIYVEDIACALKAMIGDRRVFRQVFNLAAPEQVDYAMLFRALEQGWGKPFSSRAVTCAQAEWESIPLPFPLEENLCCDGTRISRTLGLSYTSLEKGMAQTVAAFRPVFQHIQNTSQK